MDDFNFSGFPSFLVVALALACATIPNSPLHALEETRADELPAEVEKAFEAFAQEAAELRLGMITAIVETRALKLAEQLALETAEKDKLAEHFPKIVEETRAAWREDFQKTLRPSLLSTPDPLEALKGWNAKAFAGNSYYASTRPDRTEAWRNALAAVLSPEQGAEYAAAEKAEAEKLRGELADYFLRCEEIATLQLEPIMEMEVEQIKQLAALDGPRVDRLKAAAKSATAGTIGDWRLRWEDRVSEMDAEQRKRYTGNQSSVALDAADEDNPKDHPAWKDALATVLTETERTEIEKRRLEIRAARSEALAMVLIAALDPFIGFTSEQRGKLTRLLAKPLLTLPDYYFVAQAQNTYYAIDAWQMFTQIAGIVEQEVLPMLEEGQRKRWEGLAPQNLVPNRSVQRPSTAPEVPASEIDEIEAQRLVTRYIYTQAKEYTAQHLSRMETMVDGILRLGELDAEKVALLRTAAKGAARELASNDIDNFENWARQSLLNVAPVDLPARLLQINTPNFSRRESLPVPPVWTGTIDGLLSPDQMKAWEAEGAAGKQWETDTKLAILMTEIDRIVLLPPEKQDALRKIVISVLGEYEQDLDNMFSQGWHVQGYYCTIPLALLSDEQLAPALDKEQIGILRGRNPEGFEGLIENLKSNREARAKEGKQKKEADEE